MQERFVMSVMAPRSMAIYLEMGIGEIEFTFRKTHSRGIQPGNWTGQLLWVREAIPSAFLQIRTITTAMSALKPAPPFKRTIVATWLSLPPLPEADVLANPGCMDMQTARFRTGGNI